MTVSSVEASIPSTKPIVCKFGGSSVADATQIEKVRSIVAADPRRRFVVVSAPGRLHPDHEKITDHLWNIATDGAHFEERRPPISADDSHKAVINTFSAILDGLHLEAESFLGALERDLATAREGDERIAFIASRGEHYSARIVTEYFCSQGMSARVCLPEDFGFRVEGSLLGSRVHDSFHDGIASLATDDAIAVVPGYYGITETGEIAVFSRGGSDLTGGEIAYAVDAEAYENWTDVSGVFEADPRILPEAQAIPRLTFKEIRLLASKGFNVFHLDAMVSCRKRGVPIHIRNTNQPEDPGTRILTERVPEEGVVGLARLDDVAYIYLEKDNLSEEVGFTASLLKIFQELGVTTYHYPSDKDDIAVLVDQHDLKGNINDLRRFIEARLCPDVMDVVYNLSILTPVGLGLKQNSNPVVAAIAALARDHIPIQMFHQSPSQLCFHIGVTSGVADEASRSLYKALIRSD